MDRLHPKKCVVCENILRGRNDKLFCNSSCKSAFHYAKRLKENAFYFEVDRILKTNRKLLKRYIQKKYTTISKDDLHREGFNPNFYTHMYKDNTGAYYFFAYDFGFLNLQEKSKYLIVKWQDYMQKPSVPMSRS